MDACLVISDKPILHIIISSFLDFIQEDVDAMQSEYDQWTIELEQNLHLLKVDESLVYELHLFLDNQFRSEKTQMI